jgi:hypothetical protein
MVLAAFGYIGLTPAVVCAQDADKSHWGVSVSATPSWEMMDRLKDVLFDEGEDGTLKGSEFTVGVVRGSMRGGDWGVSFVRKPFDDGSGTTETREDCFGPNQTSCQTSTSTTATQGVYLNGVQVHGFLAFVKIRDRAQIGLNIAGGIATVNGDVVKTEDGFEPVGFNPKTQQPILAPYHRVETLLAKDELLPYFPLFKLEAEGAVKLAPGLKLQVAGGVNFPSVSFRIGAVYLIGAH